MSTDYFSFLYDETRKQRDAILATAPRVPESRPCEQCERIAWLVDYDDHGGKTFQCSHGHLKVIEGLR